MKTKRVVFGVILAIVVMVVIAGEIGRAHV